MAVPRNRSSNQKKNSRRSHHAKTALNFKSCSNCNALILSHKVCASCGFYKNRPVVQTQEV
jgi:large subunit ribosomal protein L32